MSHPMLAPESGSGDMHWAWSLRGSAGWTNNFYDLITGADIGKWSTGGRAIDVLVES